MHAFEDCISHMSAAIALASVLAFVSQLQSFVIAQLSVLSLCQNVTVWDSHLLSALPNIPFLSACDCDQLLWRWLFLRCFIISYFILRLVEDIKSFQLSCKWFQTSEIIRLMILVWLSFKSLKALEPRNYFKSIVSRSYRQKCRVLLVCCWSPSEMRLFWLRALGVEWVLKILEEWSAEVKGPARPSLTPHSKS